MYILSTTELKLLLYLSGFDVSIIYLFPLCAELLNKQMMEKLLKNKYAKTFVEIDQSVFDKSMFDQCLTKLIAKIMRCNFLTSPLHMAVELFLTYK